MPPNERDTGISVACMWLAHAAQTLLERSLSDPAYDLDEDEGEEYEAGPLFAGRSGLSRGRWQFWRQRLDVAFNIVMPGGTLVDIILARASMEAAAATRRGRV